MAYVVARRDGRFEIRESEHTANGPRARTLASFRVLSGTVLSAAADKARRAFDVQSVLASGRRAGAAIDLTAATLDSAVPRQRDAPADYSAFLAATRRMARVTSRAPHERMREDPGSALMELLSFADAVALSQPPVPARGAGIPRARSARARERSRAGARTAHTRQVSLMSARRLDGLAARILAAHEMLDSLKVPHQFGGAIALAWYRSPRATTDIDLNVTVAPKDAAPVLGALKHLGVSISAADRKAIASDGQARLDWEGSYLDLFFATLDLHQEMATYARTVKFGPAEIPILSPEHLIVCKAIFDRPKDWVDIEEIVSWGTKIESTVALDWIEKILGPGSEQHARLATMLTPSTR